MLDLFPASYGDIEHRGQTTGFCTDPRSGGQPVIECVNGKTTLKDGTCKIVACANHLDINVNKKLDDIQKQPYSVTLKDGSFVLIWSSNHAITTDDDQTDNTFNVYYQIFNAVTLISKIFLH